MLEIVADSLTRSTSGRSLVGLRFLVLTLLGGIVLFGAVPPAQAASSLEQQFLSLVNAERTARGLPALVLEPVISDNVSRPWSAHLAETGQLAHSNVLVDTLAYFPTTTNAGENVGYASSVPLLHSALMASPKHQANLLSSTFRSVGIGVVEKGGQVWVTQTFFTVKLSTAPPAAPSAPAPSPTAAEVLAAKRIPSLASAPLPASPVASTPASVRPVRVVPSPPPVVAAPSAVVPVPSSPSWPPVAEPSPVAVAEAPPAPAAEVQGSRLVSAESAPVSGRVLALALLALALSAVLHVRRLR